MRCKLMKVASISLAIMCYFLYFDVVLSKNVVSAIDDVVKLEGTLVTKFGLEVKIRSLSDLVYLKGRTLRLVSAEGSNKGKNLEFEIRNVTKFDHKGNNNRLLFNVIQEILVENEESDDDIYEHIIDLTQKGDNYKKLLSKLDTDGELHNQAELVVVECYDNSFKANVNNKTKISFIFGGGEYNGNNLVLEDSDEEDLKTKNEHLTRSQKRTLNAIKTVTKKKNRERTINLSLNKLRIPISSDIINAIKTVNPNSTVQFKKRDRNGNLVYKWQINPCSVHKAREINMQLKFKNNKIDNLMKKYPNVQYRTISMQQMGDLGSKFSIGAKFNLNSFNKEKLKLYSVNLETGKLEKKAQRLELSGNGMLYFETEYGTHYIITDNEI